ncbi:hypothetical protein [Yersinia mollaretii]|uniref:hypothetical protein n=1 Tax=Yersinia mollaretii TaxID=33060 RepID=UPI00061CC14D|nr:hypothetical protein [Yersinia mollaretii]CNI40513.1 bacteriophage protein [Yersinia mollaretii]
MSTNINAINALKGLTCAIERLKHLEKVLHINANDPVQHLIIAATEIERLNSENIKLRGEIEKLKENTITAMQAQTNSYRERWNTIIDAITTTDAGRGLLYRGMDIDIVTDKAVAVINKTEADRKKALHTAEAFQKTRLTVEPTSDLFDAYANLYLAHYTPTHGIFSGLTSRRPGKSTRAQYATISSEIIDEVIRASSIHPTWPTDAVHAVSILTEESGELMKAAIEYHYNNGDIEAVREEAVQTGAMALRVLMNIDKYKRPSDEK